MIWKLLQESSSSDWDLSNNEKKNIKIDQEEPFQIFSQWSSFFGEIQALISRFVSMVFVQRLMVGRPAWFHILNEKMFRLFHRTPKLYLVQITWCSITYWLFRRSHFWKNTILGWTKLKCFNFLNRNYKWEYNIRFIHEKWQTYIEHVTCCMFSEHFDKANFIT